MSAEWKREATELLIKAYKKHPVLYDMRHPRYYNKTVRGKALAEIVEDVQQLRHETSMKDVVRKIQTLRTQFGQELTKARRHSLSGSVYQPTVWWYQGLSFLQNHIKHRSFDPNPTMGDMDSWKPDPDDSSTFNVSIVRNGKASSPNDLSNTDFDNSADELEYETEVHYEINPIDMKDIKTVELKPILSTSSSNKRESRFIDRDDRKIARISQPGHADPLHTSQSPEPEQNHTPEQTTTTLMELKPVNTIAENTLLRSVPAATDERHTSLGNFVGSQMSCIKDDYTYYETQMEILNIMNRGILRQLALDKKNSKADQEGNKDRDKRKNHD
uniref:MADF domain-containing protein n=1 Tax=Anopheles minimus TaxID=112268 RepID=A0A182W1H0_9DIPT